MLTLLSQFQAQGWENGYPKLDSLGGTDFLESVPIDINSYPAITVLSPGSGYGSKWGNLIS
jgi:hypothetical protein